MADLTTLRRSPLENLHDRFRTARVPGERGVTLTEVPFLTMVSVRVDPGSAAFGRLGRQLRVELPSACGQVASAGGHSVLWLGPDEWLVISQADPDALVAELRSSLAEDHGSVVDVSANRTTLELNGPAARHTLEKGCPVDLHPRSFSPGTAVATTVGRIPVLLWQTGATTYRVLPRASFANYVARWLLDATTEFASAQVP
ncbi:Sarcosine oxidase subunit gamma [Modestobacter italicus]|uniref:Sarcosine oxidase subunit gamma n=1 Tax=Modestobacter italicus (strain DSM 44449 / CECT 9708 / BC 501) TaxID=2732864 RepID=I4EYN7_MODI5|nr:sarcosine oxidase subunit gamma family protein [Modestobacter marinus]CCH88500.1 Sarcosine oxidase subunit gamma [Modestobacter marinus]